MAYTFGAGSGLVSPGGVLQSRTVNGVARSYADAPDEWGDIEERTYYGLSGLAEVSETYALNSGSFTLPALGLSGDLMITSVEVSTSNSDWPQCTINYTSGMASAQLEGGAVTLPSFTIEARRKAQPLAITGGDGIQSTSFTASIDLSELRDEDGDQVKWAISNAAWESSIEALAGTFAIGAGLSGELEASGLNASNTAYQTATATANGYLAITRS